MAIGMGLSLGVIFPRLFRELRVSLSPKDTAAAVPSPNSGTFSESSLFSLLGAY